MSLLALQRDFRAWIAEGSESAADRLGQGARHGLDIYQNNYRSALIAVLIGAFEQVHAWIGDERFLSTAEAHIDLTPPHGWTLDAYPRDFPETLELLFPDEPEIAELAWLDLTLSEVFVGADADPLDPASLGDVDWDHAVLRLSPTLTTAIFRSNAAAIWSALSNGDKPPPAATLSEPAMILVWRKAFTPCFRTAEPGEDQALGLARQGASFGAICAALIDRHGEAAGVAMAGSLLSLWISDGLLIAVE